MIVSPLAHPEIAAKGYTHAIEIDYTDLSGTAATTLVIPILTVGLGDVVEAAGFRLNTAFDASDAAINSLLLEVGFGGATANFIAQTELALDGTEILAFVTSNSVNTIPAVFLAADTVDALFTVAGGGSPLLSELTSGKVTIYLRMGKVG
jgi:hypothetical protein